MDADALLRAARRSRRVSQRELADLAGVPSSTVSRIEAGTTVPRVDTMAALAEALGFELVICDLSGRVLTADPKRDALVDRAGRRFPAHLHMGPTPGYIEGGWWGWHHIAFWPSQDRVPENTYWRRRKLPEFNGHDRFDTQECGRMWDDAT
jgi:transcriptional regulator with XRE-family HTH domain